MSACQSFFKESIPKGAVALEFHPVANLFPMMSAEEYQGLVEDIRLNGLQESIWTHEGKIIDGRNRYKACCEAGVAPSFRVWDGKGSLVSFVVALNLKRRHLSSSQKAMVASDMLPLLEDEARKRQSGGQGGILLSQILDQANHGKAAQHAATAIGTNRQYVADAKRITIQAPEVAEKVREGKITLPEAKALVRLPEQRRVEVMAKVESGESRTLKDAEREIKREERVAITKASEATNYAESEVRTKVEVGQWWQLGKHMLFCGDTGTPSFYDKVPRVTFAFADPPYNADVAEWDSNFIWSHDWLKDKAPIVAVTPGIEGLFNFARITLMPYKWSLACWIDNGMTRGAMGFGNWIYVALFSEGSVHRNSQDFIRVSIKTGENEETRHKGRKPSELLVRLLDTFTNPGEAVIDPFLGSGTTLLVAEAAGRVCYGGEISPEFCQDIIARWESMTGKKAVLA